MRHEEDLHEDWLDLGPTEDELSSDQCAWCHRFLDDCRCNPRPHQVVCRRRSLADRDAFDEDTLIAQRDREKG